MHPAPASHADRAWLDVDLSAVVANARTWARLTGLRLMPVVKADAYGLGAGPVVQALEAVEPWGYGVGTVDEGRELRALGITRPILVLTPLVPALAREHAAYGLRPSIGDLDALRSWLALGGDPAPFHVEIDTGMGRAGFRWDDASGLSELVRLAGGAPGWEGIFTHFHSAETDAAASQEQWRRFESVLEGLARRPPLVHGANSAAGLHGFAQGSDLARPGLFLYGGRVGSHAPLPVAALRARVVACRRIRAGDTVSYGATWRAAHDTTIVTLAIGYSDGVPLSLGGRGVVELCGALHPIVGRITMDMTMVAVGDAPIAVGAVATLFGGLVGLEEYATAAGLSPYATLTAVGPRVIRRHA
jgi:alanine racemase